MSVSFRFKLQVNHSKCYTVTSGCGYVGLGSLSVQKANWGWEEGTESRYDETKKWEGQSKKLSQEAKGPDRVRGQASSGSQQIKQRAGRGPAIRNNKTV